MLKKLISEMILNEEGSVSDEPPKKFANCIARLIGHDDLAFELLTTCMFWQPSPGLGTCGVRPYGDGDHMLFLYDPAFVDALSQESAFFLLAHELYHITSGHAIAEQYASAGKNDWDHQAANIAMDTWINTDLYNEKKFGGFTTEPPFDSYGFRAPDKWGDIEKTLEKMVEKKTGKKVTLKYEGTKVWDSLYEWYVKIIKEYNLDNSDPNQEIENIPEPGCIIKLPDGSFGQVISIDKTKKIVTEIEPLTKQEAYDRVKAQK